MTDVAIVKLKKGGFVLCERQNGFWEEIVQCDDWPTVEEIYWALKARRGPLLDETGLLPDDHKMPA